MRINKKDRIGTIHDLPIQLANMAEMDEINPVSIKDKNEYIKILEKYNIFKKNLTLKEKKKIVSSLKVMNFNEKEIEYQKRTLKQITSYNRIIDKKRIEIENEIRSGKNVKVNDLILKNVEPVEVEIPRDIRINLRIHEKSVLLRKIKTSYTKNRINYYSGLNYNFLIKDGFNKPYFISYDKLQSKRRDGTVVEFLLENFKNGVIISYQKDKKALSESDKKKWAAKKLVYDKIVNEVLDHNIKIATNKEYNEPFVKRDKDGKISKRDSKIPILMDITGELIDLYIP
jgi:hypothetical protein